MALKNVFLELIMALWDRLNTDKLMNRNSVPIGDIKFRMDGLKGRVESRIGQGQAG